MKKCVSVFLISLCLLILSACSGADVISTAKTGDVIKEVTADLNVIEDKVDITIEDIDKLAKDIVNVYGHSSWFGFDNDHTAYGLKFDNNICAVMIVDKSGKTILEESISIDPSLFDYSKLMEYKAVDIFDKGAKCQLLFDGKNPYFRVEGVYLSESDIAGIDDMIRQINISSIAMDYLDNSKCWIGCKENQTCTLKFDEDAIYLTYMVRDGDFISREERKTDWNLGINSFSVYDEYGIKINDYDWKLESEGALKILTLNNEDEEILLYELDKASMEDGNQVAVQYLSHRIELDQVAEMNKLLEKYKGVSIVDGLVSAGINPSFDNRKEIASKIGIEGYKGTAEQNLLMIEKLGGKVE